METVKQFELEYCDVKVTDYGDDKKHSLWRIRSELNIPAWMACNENHRDILQVLGQYIWLNKISHADSVSTMEAHDGQCKSLVSRYTLHLWHPSDATVEEIRQKWKGILDMCVNDGLFHRSLEHLNKHLTGESRVK